MMIRTTLAIVPVVLALVLGGCSPHTLRGRVIQGDVSYISFVDGSDPRLLEEARDITGVPGVTLTLTLDPGRISRDRVAVLASGPDGEFELPVDRFGAGLIQMEMGLTARRSGFQSAETVFTLPLRGGSRLLVVLAPGRDPPGAYEEPWSAEEDLRRFGQ